MNKNEMKHTHCALQTKQHNLLLMCALTIIAVKRNLDAIFHFARYSMITLEQKKKIENKSEILQISCST